MTWTVQVNPPWRPLNQNTVVPWAGNSSNDNHTLNCGETNVTMCLQNLRDVYVAPDVIRDVIIGFDKTGTTVASQLQAFFQTYANIPTTIWTPTEMQNASKTGLFDIIWSYLVNGSPLISLGTLDLGGTLYNHWRTVTALSDTMVTQSDPWTGTIITEPWLKQWSAFKGYIIGIDKARPSDL